MEDTELTNLQALREMLARLAADCTDVSLLDLLCRLLATG